MRADYKESVWVPFLLLALLALFSEPALAQKGLPVLSSADDQGSYDQVLPSTRLSFPQDYGRHDGFRLEWWYITATLQTDEGQPLGVQWTLFRTALAPPGKDGVKANAPLLPPSPWRQNHVWMAHAALTTPTRHFFQEKFARGVGGEAGVTLENGLLKAWLADWSLSATTPQAYQLSAVGEDFSYNLRLEREGPEILQGQNGYSLKSSNGQASHYFSQPYLSVSGMVELAGKAHKVTGMAWLDREWSSQFLSTKQVGWDWFAIRLDSGAVLTAAQVREEGKAPFRFATLVAGDEKSHLSDMVFIPLQKGAPTKWRLKAQSKGLDIVVEALNEDSWNRGIMPYFEGPIRISGSHTGTGYLEMTGYAAPPGTENSD